MLNKLYDELVAFAKAEGKKVEDVLEHAKVFLEGKIAEHKGASIEGDTTGESAPVAAGESASGNETVAAAPVVEPTAPVVEVPTEAPVVEPTTPVVEPAT